MADACRRHDHRRPRVSRHECEALGRILGIERHKRPARLQDTQQRDDQRCRALEADTDEHFGTHTQDLQVVRELIRPRIQRRIRQRLPLAHDRHRVRRSCDLRLQLRDDVRRRLRLARRIPFGQLTPLAIGEQRHGVVSPIRSSRQRLERAPIIAADSVDQRVANRRLVILEPQLQE